MRAYALLLILSLALGIAWAIDCLNYDNDLDRDVAICRAEMVEREQ